jgi:hypothetical protein
MSTQDQEMSPEERRRLLEQLPPATPLTLARAAWLGNFRSASALRMAVRRGALHATKHSDRVVLTTAGDLLVYLRAVQQRGVARGHPRPEHEGAGDRTGQ